MIDHLVEVYAPPQTELSVRENPSVLRDAEVIFSGWGMPVMDEAFLTACPNLKAVFYGAGSIKGIVTPAFWAKNIIITSSYAANAIPTSEYTLSQILFCLKRGWYFAMAIKKEGRYPPQTRVPGAYGSVVGIISLGLVGRGVCRLLQPFDLTVIAYDPYISLDEAAELQVELCSLEEIFQQADVVSLHSPRLKKTEGMITGDHLASMKESATFINTSRGAIVREMEMIEVLQKRPDLQAILDVTDPEPPEPASLLYVLPNVVLTPHIAGGMNNECRRQGEIVVDQLKRYLNREPLQWSITEERAKIMA